MQDFRCHNPAWVQTSLLLAASLVSLLASSLANILCQYRCGDGESDIADGAKAGVWGLLESWSDSKAVFAIASAFVAQLILLPIVKDMIGPMVKYHLQESRAQRAEWHLRQRVAVDSIARMDLEKLCGKEFVARTNTLIYTLFADQG